jgi:hypothetical protein
MVITPNSQVRDPAPGTDINARRVHKVPYGGQWPVCLNYGLLRCGGPV